MPYLTVVIILGKDAREDIIYKLHDVHVVSFRSATSTSYSKC